jgi:hypothetical protein
MGRTVIVGDVHGCLRELEELLETVGYDAKVDRLVFVGDVIARGPDSRGVLDLVDSLGATVVRGNHEEKVLQGKRRPERIDGEHRRLAEKLSPRQWRQLEAMPLWLDLPEHAARVVHAGVIPGLPIQSTPREALLRIRSIDDGGWTDEKKRRAFWGERYVGPPHVLFGHNAMSEPQFHEWATGLDTGCVYGRRLTAMVLDGGEHPPRGRAAKSKLTSVAARREYHSPKR